MTTQGRLQTLFKDLLHRKYILQVECDTDVTEEYEKLRDKDVDIKIVKHREKRSLDANAYYWKLVSMIADKMKTKNSVIHNRLLRDYGTIEPEWFTVVPDTDEDENHILESEFYHLKPTTDVRAGRDGRMWRTYLMIRGSHLYDTKEMSRLIDGTVQEAKELGIETLPPEELARLKAEWRKNE